MTRTSLPTAALALWLAGCALPDIDPRSDGAGDGGGFIRTDRARYTAVLVADDPPRYELDIPFTYRNTTGRTLYLIGCHNPSRPVLQERAGSGWTTVYASVEPECLSPPWELRPGATRRDTLRVVAFLPGRNAFPVAETDFEGIFRLEGRAYSAPHGGHPLPAGQRLSNEFEIDVEP